MQPQGRRQLVAENIDGVTLCLMFSKIISGQSLPKYLSSDHDPLFRYHQWHANLSILDIEEIKTVPYTPESHPFIERLIDTIRQEYLDHVFFWNKHDLERKLVDFQSYYNENRCHSSIAGETPSERCGGNDKNGDNVISLENYKWRSHCNGLFELLIAA